MSATLELQEFGYLLRTVVQLHTRGGSTRENNTSNGEFNFDSTMPLLSGRNSSPIVHNVCDFAQQQGKVMEVGYSWVNMVS